MMISGYHSLGCGLSAYHWQQLVHLAYFACLTHMAALTSLRSHFHHDPTSRLLRFPLMTALVIMLVVAFIPTGHFQFDKPLAFHEGLWDTVYDLGHVELQNSTNKFILVHEASPAICYFKTFSDPAKHDLDSFYLMIHSIISLVLGYLVRAYKLFHSPSLSYQIQLWLDTCHFWILKKWSNAIRLLHPSLGLVLTCTFLPCLSSVIFWLKYSLDWYSSMAFEVRRCLFFSSNLRAMSTQDLKLFSPAAR
jgi:hypothetical protein